MSKIRQKKMKINEHIFIACQIFKLWSYICKNFDLFDL